MNRKCKTLFAFIIAVFMVSMFGCNSCPKQSDQPAVEESDSKRLHKAFVEQALKKPVEVRVKEYLELAGKIGSSYKIHGAYHLAREILVQQDYQGLALLESKLDDPEAKTAIWYAVSHMGDIYQSLLKKWALTYPDRYELMRYHPNGPELLISKLEDTTTPPLTRAMCAIVISEMELVSLLPRVKKFVDDKTPVPMPSAMWPWTLGGAVRECVQHLEVLSKDPKERKPVELIKSGEGRTSYYEIWIYKEAPQQFAIDDTISISGRGIVSACWRGGADKDEYGAWRVKEFDANHVVFQATCDAAVDRPFGTFTVTAPNASEGKVQWEFKGKHAGTCSGEVYGPASVADK